MRNHLILLLVIVSGLLGSPVLAGTPCTNGSFEELDAQGLPIDWAPVSPLIISTDGKGGHYSLRIVRDRVDVGTETGVNRAWMPDSGEKGAMIDRLKGGMEFWYKAISSKGAQMNVAVIPMSQRPYEDTHENRMMYEIPPQHIGDGLWHRSRIKYDYSNNPKVKWVHFAARITGGTGEFLLDEVAYLEDIGPNLVIETIRIEEDPAQPGLAGTLSARIRNTGDQDASGVRITCQPSSQIEGLTLDPPQLLLSELKIDQIERIRFRLLGKRAESVLITLNAASENSGTSDTIRIAPKMEIESFGPVSPVVIRGTQTQVECVVRNSGYAFLIKPEATFNLEGKQVKASLPWVPPGDAAALTASLVPATETLSTKVQVELTSHNCGGTLSEESSMVVAATHCPVSEQSGLLAHQETSGFIIGNSQVRLIARNNSFGISPVAIQGPDGSAWKTVAWLPNLGRVVVKNSQRQREEHLITCSPEAVSSAISNTQQAILSMKANIKDSDGGVWNFTISFSVGKDLAEVSVKSHLECDQPRELLAFDGPMVHALDRDEAIFPGLEWLVEGEMSSNDLDINKGHPHQIRYVVHPGMVTIPAIGLHSSWGTVGLIWDIKQKWNGERDRPGVVFASPDRFNHQRSHLVGLTVPTVPDFVKANQREAFNPYPLTAGKPLELAYTILVQQGAGDPLVAIDAWDRKYGFPEPSPLPHGTYEHEIEFSMRGYLESLWDAESQKWWTSKNGPPTMSFLDRPNDFIADLLLGSLFSPDPGVKAECLERARLVQSLLKEDSDLKSNDPIQPGEILSEYYPGPIERGWTGIDRIGSLLAGRDKQGAWHFDADFQDTAIFKGFDYRILGKDNTVEIGLCAQKAAKALQYALRSGDLPIYKSILPTLHLMERFHVPRAAQVWEVPVHTPDILAAADAIDAFLAAYQIDSDPRWLKEAVNWARRGLPFVYAWDEPKFAFVLGATIPVFGASLRNYSWFGLPVQWNGLRYAEALLDLADLDSSYPWRKIADLILRSAIHQQAPDGRDVALWPDNMSAIDGARCPWVFAPRQIISAIMKLQGKSLSPTTQLLREGDTVISLSTIGTFSEIQRNGDQVSFKVTYQEKLESQVLLANISRPTEVLLEGAPLPEILPHSETRSGGNWRYNSAQAYLVISVPRSGTSQVKVEGCRYTAVDRIPVLKTSIDFTFDEGFEGWFPEHEIESLEVQNGILSGQIRGGDPYLTRCSLQVDGDRKNLVEIRIKSPGRSFGQIYWSTVNSPEFREDKVVPFEVPGGDQFETIVVDPSEHPLWRSQTITAIRLDPCNGLSEGSFEIDSIRARKK